MKRVRLGGEAGLSTGRKMQDKVREKAGRYTAVYSSTHSSGEGGGEGVLCFDVLCLETVASPLAPLLEDRAQMCQS